MDPAAVALQPFRLINTCSTRIMHKYPKLVILDWNLMQDIHSRACDAVLVGI